MKPIKRDFMPIKNPLLFTGGCLAGAVGMYYADPHRGAYRRAILRDKSTHLRKVIVKRVEVAGRDLGHRTHGVLSVARARIFPELVADEILVARAGSKIGRVVANPHSITVTADRGQTPTFRLLVSLAGGIVALSGSFLAARKKAA